MVKNVLTFQIETWVGSLVVLALSAFLVGFFFVTLKNFNSEEDILTSTSAQVRSVSPQEKALIDDWLSKNNLNISASDVGYRYIIRAYPGRPWIETKVNDNKN